MNDGDLKKIADLVNERVNRTLESIKSNINELKGVVGELKDVQEK